MTKTEFIHRVILGMAAHVDSNMRNGIDHNHIIQQAEQLAGKVVASGWAFDDGYHEDPRSSKTLLGNIVEELRKMRIFVCGSEEGGEL